MESDLWPVLEDVEDDIGILSKTLRPLLEQNLPKNASLLPLVDKAKLYVQTTYTIESLLCSYLDLNGIDVKEHAVMKELMRLKQYYAKIRNLELKEEEKKKRDNLTLDREAARRFIKGALAGNDKYDAERTELLKKQKENAHIKFQELGESGDPEPQQRRVMENDDSDDEFGGIRLVTGDTDDDENEPKINIDNSPEMLSSKLQSEGTTGASSPSKGEEGKKRKKSGLKDSHRVKKVGKKSEKSGNGKGKNQES